MSSEPRECGYAIPVRLAHRPMVGGLVQPWINVILADGGTDFAGTIGKNWRRAWLEGLCQTCGQPLGSPLILLGGPNQLDGYFDEPPLHPECAAYAIRACPMVAGQRRHYRATPSPVTTQRGRICLIPGCGCGGYVPSEQVVQTAGIVEHRAAVATSPRGEPAHVWYSVRARAYAPAVDQERRLLGGVPTGIIRTREISRPSRQDPQ